MSSLPGYHLEDYVAWTLNIVVVGQGDPNFSLRIAEMMGTSSYRRPLLTHEEFKNVLELYEPYREQVEDRLCDFDEENQSWRDYACYNFDFIDESLYDKASALMKSMISESGTQPKPDEPQPTVGSAVTFERLTDFIAQKKPRLCKSTVILADSSDFNRVVSSMGQIFLTADITGDYEDMYRYNFLAALEDNPTDSPLVLVIHKTKMELSDQLRVVRDTYLDYCIDNGTHIRPLVFIGEITEKAKATMSPFTSRENMTIPGIITFLSALCVEAIGNEYSIRRISHSTEL